MDSWTVFMSSITARCIHDSQNNHLPVFDAKVASRQFNDPSHTLTNETAGVSFERLLPWLWSRYHADEKQTQFIRIWSTEWSVSLEPPNRNLIPANSSSGEHEYQM